MLNRQVLKDSLPTSAALKLLDTEGRIVAAGRAIGLVLKTMKYSHHEPDHWENDAASRTKEVSDNMTHVATASERTGAAAAGVKTTVKTVAEEADHLRSQIDDFLAQIRAA